MLRAVIFDLDGTLYDNSWLLRLLPLADVRHLLYVSRERNFRVQYRGCSYDSGEDFYQHLFRAISGSHADKASRWYHGHFMPLQVHIIRRFCKLDAWVMPRLAELRSQGVKLAVYSDYGLVSAKLQALGLDPALFDVVTDAPTLGGLKPCERSMRRLIDKLGVSANEVMVVGDRKETDIASAQAVGAQYRLVQRRGKTVTFTAQID